MSYITGKDTVTGADDQVKLSASNLNVAQYVWNTNTLSWIKQTGGATGPGTDVNVTNFPTSQGIFLDSSVDKTQFVQGANVVDRQRVETYIGDSALVDAGGRGRVSQLTTLFDGKTLTADEPLLWDTQGTGTSTYQSNKLQMSVTAGQYLVRQSRFYTPYFSGKPQFIEETFDNFAFQTGVIKRYGYFSSSAVAPYTANYDGWYVESNGDDNTYYLVVVNNGVESLRLPWTSWTGYAKIQTYNWNNFTVSLTDFLWLGGAVLRLFVKLPGAGFVLMHQFDYAGSQTDVFMDNPQLPLRYEIRSTTGSGTFRAICSQVATEGAESERGKALTVYTPTALSASSTTTTYVLAAVRKTAAFRNTSVKVTKFASVVTTANARGGVLFLLLNPTTSAALSWTTNSRVEQAIGTGQTITAEGRVIDAIPVDLTSSVSDLTENILAELTMSIANVPGEIVLAYRPASTNQTVLGTISLIEY